MIIKLEHEIKASEIKMTEQELLDNFITTKKYSMFNIADKALGEVDWHNNMPKSTKLEYIVMLQKHINNFLSDLDYNNDITNVKPVLSLNNGIESEYALYFTENKMVISSNLEKLQNIIKQHMHILDINAEVNVCDWVYNEQTGCVYRITPFMIDQTGWDIYLKKVIASTDSLEDLPKLSIDVLTFYVDYYNKHGKFPDSTKAVV